MRQTKLYFFLFVIILFLMLLSSGCSSTSSTTSSSDSTPDSTTTPSATRPLITAVTPMEVKAGANITVTGSGFGGSQGSSALSIGGVAANTIISWSDTEIQAVVPDNALTGSVIATVQGNSSNDGGLVVLWDNENPQNVVIPGNHMSPLQAQIIAEGVGGSIIVWTDYRSYDPAPGGQHQTNIYAQRLNSRGKTIWDADGVPLSTVAGGQYFPQLAPDGNGGALVVWEDYRGGSTDDYADIYAQRVSPSGAVLWSSDAAACSAVHKQEKPRIVSDGAGGAIIVWQDYRSNSKYDVYAQRINSDGTPQWTANGVVISAAANNSQPLFPEIVADGTGGAIVTWQDERSGAWYIYAQRVNSAGAVQWTANGVPVSTVAASNQHVPRPVADGAGGAIVGWKSSGGDLYVQRINASGEVQWGAAGTVISAAAAEQTAPQMTTDGNGGAIITWEDCRAGSAVRDIYAQRVNASGVVQWTADGVPVCTAGYSQYEPQIISDGRGGAIITWYDYRNYNLPSNGTIQGVDTYAQRLNSDGVAQWAADGAAISTATLHQMYPKIATDNSGGAIIIWEDQRTGSTVDLYAQGISFNGNQ